MQSVMQQGEMEEDFNFEFDRDVQICIEKPHQQAAAPEVKQDEALSPIHQPTTATSYGHAQNNNELMSFLRC